MTPGRGAGGPARTSAPSARQSDSRLPGGRQHGRRPPGRRWRWRAALAAVGTATLTAAVAWALLGSGLLAVRAVRLTGPVPVPRSQVLAAAAIRFGTPLLRVDTAAVARRVERITQVQSATVRRSWPDVIIIAIRPRIARLAVPGRYGYAELDADGVLLGWSGTRPRDLALLLAPAGPISALRGRPAVHAAGQVLAALPGRLRRKVTAARSSAAAGVTLLLHGGITVHWGGTDRSAAKARELTALLRTRATYFDVSDPGTAVAGR